MFKLDNHRRIKLIYMRRPDVPTCMTPHASNARSPPPMHTRLTILHKDDALYNVELEVAVGNGELVGGRGWTSARARSGGVILLLDGRRSGGLCWRAIIRREGDGWRGDWWGREKEGIDDVERVAEVEIGGRMREDMRFGCQDPNEMEAKAENQIVERQARRKKRIVRLLLLGQSESGKSTTLRQFQRLYTPTAFREERILWRAVIQLNILLHLHFLFGEIVGALQQAQTFSLSRRRSCGTFQFLADGGVRRGLKKKKIRLEVFPGLFLNDLERITSPKYVRTNDCRRVGGLIRKAGFAGREIENSRRQASIIFKKLGYHSLMMASSQFQFCFRPSAHSASQTVDAIIFLAPISGFDQVLSEDRTVNRLVRAPELSSYPRLIAGLQEDSVLLWKAVCQNKLLANVDLVLFLNKCDILESKLKAGIRLSKYVRSYGDRENDLDTVSKYLRSKFNAIHREYSPNPRKFYAFCTSVTDTATTAGIIASVRDMVIRQHLKQSKLL
ncbi:G-protein alpha subunit-domain-containing protein [Armillaria fumosa]|nr:G-protein alpha subunit-domain-containing protein [Armillaria fumosa]